MEVLSRFERVIEVGYLRGRVTGGGQDLGEGDVFGVKLVPAANPYRVIRLDDACLVGKMRRPV